MDDNEFLRKYDSFIRSFAYKYCRQEEDKADFEQELRIRLWTAYKTHYDPEKGKLSTWVYQTLQLHARKLRFDILKQESFERGILKSDYYHHEHYKYDPYFLLITSEESISNVINSGKFPELEYALELSLSSNEKRVYTALLKYYPNVKPSKICRELNLTVEEFDSLHISIKAKVMKIYRKLYNTDPTS